MMMAVMNVTSASWQDQGVPQVSATILRMGQNQWVRATSRIPGRQSRKKKATWVAMALSCTSELLPIVDCRYFAEQILGDEPTDHGLVIDPD